MIDMLSLLPEHTGNPFDSRHRLVIAASQRAKQLMQNAQPTIASGYTKETTQAIDEMLHGSITFLVGKDARQAMKDAKRVRESELERMALAAAVTAAPLGEDAREIKKELSVYVDDSAKPGSGMTDVEATAGTDGEAAESEPDSESQP